MATKTVDKKRKNLSYNRKQIFDYYSKESKKRKSDIYNAELKDFAIKYIKEQLPEYYFCDVTGDDLTRVLVYEVQKRGCFKQK